MAEVLGLTASIIGIIEITAKITKLVYQYINEVRKASESISMFLKEIGSLTYILNILEEFRKKNPHLSAIQTLEKPVGECLIEMTKLAERLEPKNNSSWWKISIIKLKWPLKDREMSEYLDRIERFKSLVMLTIGAANLSQQVAVGGGVRVTGQIQLQLQGPQHLTNLPEDGGLVETKVLIEEEKRKLVFHWLYPDAFDQRHAEISERRQENTGHWLLETQEFKNWASDTGSRLLWVHGVVGAGKTFMTSFIIDHLQTSQEVYGVAYIYFDYKDQERQNPTSVLASLGKQLACQIQQTVPKELENLYDELSGQQRRPTLEQLYQILLGLTRFFDKTFIVCDSLDEYPGQRKELLRLFHRMEGNDFRLFLTSSENCNDAKESFQDSAKIRFYANSENVASYIERRVKDLKISGEFKPLILSELTTCTNGMFLLELANFHIKHLYKQNGKDQILELLKVLKDSTTRTGSPFGPIYSRLMTAFRHQDPKSLDMGRDILLWLVKTQRTLNVRELQLAVSMHMRQRKGKSFLETDLPDRKKIVDVCANLVIIDENDTIKLIHYTAQEFLLKNLILPKDPDLKIALACTSYLSLNTFAQGPCITDSSLNARRKLHPFHKYASENLSCHLKSCDEASTTNAVLSFLKDTGCVKSYFQALHYRTSPSSTIKVSEHHTQYPEQQTMLHIAASLGHLAVTKKLLQKNSTKINAPNGDGKTSMLVAAIEGHEKIVNLLLEKGADPSISDKIGITPLHVSISHGHGPKSMFRVLIDSGIDLSIADHRGCTPLHWAASQGLEPETRTLIDKGADVEDGDKKGRQALHVAALYGHESVVRLLLEKGAKTPVSDKSGNTPLHMAAEGGHLNTIELLLGRGADNNAIAISVVNNRGCTPLHLAASSGHQKAVQLLVGRGANISSADEAGWTALHYAAEKGHEAVVGALLERGGNPSSRDKDGATVLHRAVRYEPILKLLLEKGAKITWVDNRGRTVLHWACSLGGLNVVMLLLENNARFSAVDDEGRTALHFAAFKGHKSIVELLRQAGADPSAVDDRGQTAYQVAVGEEHDLSIIELLEPIVDNDD